MQRSRVTRIVAGFTLVAALAACGGSAEKTGGNAPAAGEDVEGSLVGVTMPTRSSERWIADGDNVKAALEELGYEVSLEYAEDKIPTQVEQIENQIAQGARVLIVAAIDGTALTTQLEQAQEQGIKVISYDRLIRDTEAVDYYASFDNYKVGVQQATSLLQGLGLVEADGTTRTDEKGPFNIELFAGSPDDNNATFFFDGAMDTLKPFLDDKTLVVKSGETDFETVATLRWDPATAQARMENVITKAYGDAKIDGVLSPYDGISIGILSALKSAGYGNGEPYPIVSGQDAETASVKSIAADEQFATIFKDTRELADVAVDMADKVLKGEEPEVNNTEDYNNGVKVVPSQLLEPVIVYKDNYKEILVDSGYIDEADLS